MTPRMPESENATIQEYLGLNLLHCRVGDANAIRIVASRQGEDVARNQPVELFPILVTQQPAKSGIGTRTLHSRGSRAGERGDFT